MELTTSLVPYIIGVSIIVYLINDAFRPYVKKGKKKKLK